MSRQRLLDLLFGGQLIGAFVFCIPQIVRSQTSVHGVSIVQFALVAAFSALNLWLAADARSESTDKGWRSWQLITTYGVWLLLSLGMVAGIMANPAFHWNGKESSMVGGAVLSTVFIAAYAQWRQLLITDPMIKALLAIAYKAIPQVLLAQKILSEGGSGLTAVTVVIGHVTIGIRFVQIHLTTSGRPRFWLFVSEAANELTWIVVSIMWMAKEGIL